jgi:uncharacterized protein YecE (DUF72 family)
MSRFLVGTASFTGKDLEGSFYPKGMKPAERISFYAQHFNAVEIDSSYYALPSTKNSILFDQRTPADFVFNFKAYGLMTKHRVQTRQLGRALSMYLPPSFDNTYLQNPPQDLLKTAFDMFYEALYPLKSSGKLGLVLFQFPPYFTKTQANKEYILQCKEWMRDYELAIEFRHGSWVKNDSRQSLKSTWSAGGGVNNFDLISANSRTKLIRGREVKTEPSESTNAASAEVLNDTLQFLTENNLTYVSVDEPQFASGSTVPPIAEATNRIAYIRFHGRNTQNWFRKDAGVEGRFDYFYNNDELAEWVPKIKNLAGKADQIYIMLNNCVNIYPVKNAKDLASMLGVLQDKRPFEISTQTSIDF